MIYSKTFTQHRHSKNRFVKELDRKFQVSTTEECFTRQNELEQRDHTDFNT